MKYARLSGKASARHGGGGSAGIGRANHYFGLGTSWGKKNHPPRGAAKSGARHAGEASCGGGGVIETIIGDPETMRALSTI